MGKVKEQLFEESLELEQSFGVGDTVLVYDSKYALEPQLGQVVYTKVVSSGETVLDLVLSSGDILQVYDIQCRHAVKKQPRKIWIKDFGRVDMIISAVPPDKDAELWTLFTEVQGEG